MRHKITKSKTPEHATHPLTNYILPPSNTDKWSRMCPHTTAKCANCGGPHGARADACAAKRIVQHAAREWRTPPPPRREQRRETPGDAAPGAEEEDEPEARGVAKPDGDGMEE